MNFKNNRKTESWKINLAPCPSCLCVWLPEGNKSPGMQAVGGMRLQDGAGGWPAEAARESLGKDGATAGKMSRTTALAAFEGSSSGAHPT